MTKILNKKVIIALAAMFAGACTSDGNAENTPEYLVQPLVKSPNSVVVCRDKQCAPARLSMSKEYIYNSLLQLLQNNKGSKALVCSADSASHVCTEEYLVMPLKVGVTPANMYIDDVKITDVKIVKGKPRIDLVLNYNVTYNGQTPDCRPAKSLVFVDTANSIILEDSGYECKMTAVSSSTVRTMIAVDYIDLDYGYIGGYYSIGVSGPANGGGAGYMMFRLPTNAYPLSPELKWFDDEEDEEVYKKSPSEEGNVVIAPEKDETKAEAENPTETPAKAEEKAPAATPAATPAEAPAAVAPAVQPVALPTPVPAEYMPQPVPAGAQPLMPMPQQVPMNAPMSQPVPMMAPAPQSAYGAPIPASGQIIQVDICNGTTANIYPGAQVQEVCNGVPVQVVPEPALRPEIMVEPQPNMDMHGPASVDGKPLTKTVVEDASEVKKKSSKVEIFPIYTKKSIEKGSPVEDKEVSAGETLKDAVEDTTKTEDPKTEEKE